MIVSCDDKTFTDVMRNGPRAGRGWRIHRNFHSTNSLILLVGLRFCMSQDMRLQISGLREFLRAPIKGAHVWPVTCKIELFIIIFPWLVYKHTCMNSDMSSKIEVEGKSLPTSFKSALEWFLAGMNQLVSLQFTRFHKRFATFSTNMDTGTVSMEMLSHGRIVSKHLLTTCRQTSIKTENILKERTFMWTCNCPRIIV